MMATVYEVNRGINKSIEFKGIKAQYITYLAAGIMLLMLLFGILYACGLNIYLCLLIVLPLGAALVISIKGISRTYGEHGLVKRLAGRRLPGSISCHSRKPFVSLKKKHEK